MGRSDHLARLVASQLGVVGGGPSRGGALMAWLSPILEKSHPEVHLGLQQCPLCNDCTGFFGRDRMVPQITYAARSSRRNWAYTFLYHWLASTLLTHVLHDTTISMPGVCGLREEGTVGGALTVGTGRAAGTSASCRL